MKFLRTIRTRLTLWFSIWLTAILLIFGGIRYFIIQSILLQNLDHSLRTEVTWLEEFIRPREYGIKPGKREPSQRPVQKRLEVDTLATHLLEEEMEEVDSVWNQIYEHTILNAEKKIIHIQRSNGDLLYKSPPAAQMSFHIDRPRDNTIRVKTLIDEQGAEYRVAVGSTENIQILVAYPLSEMRALGRDLFINFLFLIPFAFLVALVGGWFLTSRSLKPVDDITNAVRRITLRNLGQTLPVAEPEDELGRLSTTFNEMIGRLKTSVEKMKQFAADASHELRTPLTIMRGEIEVMLRSKKVNHSTKKLLQSMNEEIVRLSAIVDGLMLLIKAEEERMTLHFHHLKLDQLLSDLAVDASYLAKPKNIVVILQKNEPTTIMGDEERIRQLFRNLIDNAVRYTSRRGKITLSLVHQNGKALVRIADTGIGIPKKDLPKIFDRFYRSSTGEKFSVDGSGLGLSIARWIAQAHDAEIHVSSQPRKGTTFTVEFPLASF